MILENFNYRTNPLFLRNQFNSANSFGIPDVPKAKFTDDELRNLLMLGFNQLKKDNGGMRNELFISFYMTTILKKCGIIRNCIWNLYLDIKESSRRTSACILKCRIQFSFTTHSETDGAELFLPQKESESSLQ